MELFKAHKQWKNRPDDERFQTVSELYQVTKAYRDSAREQNVPFKNVRAENVNGDVQLMGNKGIPARLTNWAFGQLCARVAAPASYLRELPATLAVQNLNHGLAGLTSDAVASMLFHQNGSLILRALTSKRYERIWNYEVAERLQDMETRGWQPAVPDIRAFNGNQTALYASDHDMFAFLRTENQTVAEPGSDRPLWRGVIVENSEVGASALKITRFLYREMCGNHIIWGASEVSDVSLRHVGTVRERWNAFAVQARKWADESVSDEEAKIAHARTTLIADTKEGVLDALFGKRVLGISRKTLEAGYQAVNVEEDGDPRTSWGIVQGLTRHSQTLPFADSRTELDKAAGRILEVF